MGLLFSFLIGMGPEVDKEIHGEILVTAKVSRVYLNHGRLVL